MPIRIQRKRTKGWKMPENTIYVGRNRFDRGRFGSPFKIGSLVKIGNGKSQGEFSFCELNPDFKHLNDGSFIEVIDNSHSVELYKKYIDNYPLSKQDILFLKGKNLACWCKIGEPCHADILLEKANK